MDGEKELPARTLRKNFILTLIEHLVFYISIQFFFILPLYHISQWFVEFVVLPIFLITLVISQIIRDKTYQKTINRSLGKKYLLITISLQIVYFLIVAYLAIYYFRLEESVSLFLTNILHLFLYALSISIFAVHIYLDYHQYLKVREVNR